jgi:hypothetical protein
MCLIIKSNSIEHLYSAKGSNRWAFAPRKDSSADQALLTFLKGHLKYNSGLIAVFTNSNDDAPEGAEYGALLYGHVKMNADQLCLNTTTNRYWYGPYNIIIDVEWSFIRPDESLVTKDELRSILVPGDKGREGMQAGHYPMQITPAEFFKIIQS